MSIESNDLIQLIILKPQLVHSKLNKCEFLSFLRKEENVANLNELILKITFVTWSQEFKSLNNYVLSLERTQDRKSCTQGTQEMPEKKDTKYSHLADPTLKVSLSLAAAQILYREERWCKMR